MKTSAERTKDILARADAERARRKKRIKLTSVLAAGLSLVLALNLVLFIPYNTALPDISAYRGSEYYSLMQQINELTYRPPQYKNNFEAWFGGLFGGAKGDMMEAPGDMGGADDDAYAEVTDKQVQGVIEGDLFKRTDSHIFYLNTQPQYTGYTLYAYTVAGEESAQCGALTILPDEGTTFRGYADGAEIYLSGDGNTVTLFTPVFVRNGKTSGVYTEIVGIDVSDPANMRETGRRYVSGNYVTSRSVEGDFLLVSEFAVYSNPDFSDEAQYLPQAGELGDMETLPAGDIICPDVATAARYTVVTRLNESAEIEDCLAFFSYTDEVYVSENNNFVTRGYNNGEAAVCGEYVSYTVRESRTEISAVSYAGGELTLLGSADIPGTVKDQYSMDERDGTLRVVTTLYRRFLHVAGDTSYLPDEGGQNAGVYVISLRDFTVLGCLEWFAPDGEEVMSVRFEKEENAVWVCTAIELTDPVFKIVLSDPAHLTYIRTADIHGYSTSLVDFTGDTLLGVGYGSAWDTLKIEVYAEGEAGSDIHSLASYEAENVSFSSKYKAYLIDRENALIGLHVNFYGDGSYYLLLHFDGEQLSELEKMPIFSGLPAQTRAIVIDDWLYILTPVRLDFTAIELNFKEAA